MNKGNCSDCSKSAFGPEREGLVRTFLGRGTVRTRRPRSYSNLHSYEH